MSLNHSISPQQTFELGKKLGLKLKHSDLVCLYGDLGVGKTVFTKGIAETLGIEPQRVKSPTFVFARDYKLKEGKFCHLDLYRIGGKVDLQGLGLIEILENPENICVVEWAEKLGSWAKGRKKIEVKIIRTEEEEREVEIKWVKEV